MPVEHVKGEKKGEVMLYALSTCGWCKKTKSLLNDLGIDYHYTFVDLLTGAEKNKTIEEISKWNPQCSFPTIVIDNKICIVGFQPEELQKRFGK